MVKKQNNFDFHLDNKIEKERKEIEAERISVIKEMLKGLELAYATDVYTIPVVQANVDDLFGVTMHPYENQWDHDKIDPRTPIILERSKNVIAGPIQYFESKEKGIKTIDVVYLDSLRNKIINADTLRKQFQDPDICISFAYSLFAMLSNSPNPVSYDYFKKHFDILFVQKDICCGIYEYIWALDERMLG